jgi:hypothetical protein
MKLRVDTMRIEYHMAARVFKEQSHRRVLRVSIVLSNCTD